MNRKSLGFSLAFPLALLALSGCSDDASDDAALDGQGGSCTVEDRGDGTAVIRCADGSEFTVSNGTPGTDGKDGSDGNDGNDGKDAQEPPCALSENDDGTHTLTCGNESVVVGAPCEGGFPGDLVLTAEGDVEAASNVMLFQVSTCTWIRGDLEVSEYPGEELPKFLSRIEKVDGHVLVEKNPELVAISLPALKTVGGNCDFFWNPSLVETSLPALETVGESLRWFANAELEAVGELPKLAEVGEHLGWANNPKLERTPTFPELTSVGADLGWIENEALVSVGGLPKLTTAGALYVIHNEALEDIGSLDALESLGHLEINDNDALVAVPGLPKLETLSGDLEITGNDELTSIAGLGNLTGVGGNFIVTVNPKLPVCDVWDLIEAIEDADGIDGTISFSGNDESDDSCLP